MSTHPLNSKTLKEVSNGTYKSFFAANPIVVSAPRNLWWTGEYAELFGALTITQKIPSRVYVGLQRVQSNTIEIGDYLEYVPSKDAFVEKQFNATQSKKLSDFLLKTISSLTGSRDFDGIRINILSELPFGHGLSATGSFTASLATALFLNYDVINPNVITSWKGVVIDDLRLDKTKHFDDIFRLAWKLETIIDSPRSSGSRSFSSMIDGHEPLIYFTERRDGTENNHPGTRFPSEIESHYEMIDEIVWWGYRFETLTGIKTPETWPYDVGLFFTGREKNSGNIIRSIDAVSEELQNVKRHVYARLNQLIPKTEKSIRPLFLELFDRDVNVDTWVRYIEALSILSLETLEHMGKLFKYSAQRETLIGFIQRLNSYQDAFHLLNVSTTTLDTICNTFAEIVDRHDISPFGLKFTGTGGGGDILFVSGYGRFEEVFDPVLGELRERFGQKVSLDYASWRDGIEDKGLLVEQMLEQNFYSPFVSEGVVFTKYWDPNNHDSVTIHSYEQFESERSRCDLLLDAIDKKIFVRGDQLTSKEIHSSKVTLDVLSQLLQSFGKEVKAEDLGSSSYVDRNEMQSKIVTPLSKAFQKRTGKKLPLELHGGIGKNFTMTLKPSNVKICLVEQKL